MREDLKPVIRAFSIVAGGTAVAVLLAAAAWYWAGRHPIEMEDTDE
jgi:hypothetical protein